ncbi:DUF5989 family protein [Tunicatimonas pelagia]|nr:DUF5989 family protein [Tunicatimonas pelagia]WKN41444.1 DUF5989 family protein [Tunicatimonas pelagia]
MGTLREFWLFVQTRKKYWLIPTLVLLILIGFLIVATSGSALAPFIYSIF